MKLITVGQAKLNKSKDEGYLTGGFNLSPHKESVPFGGINMCANAGTCSPHCLKTAGFNKMPTHMPARIERTLLMVQNWNMFDSKAEKELEAFMRKAEREGLIPVFRPNLLSDRPQLEELVHKHQPDLRCYDYTKLAKPWLRAHELYHLTYSLDTHNEREAIEAINHGINVAVVFNPKEAIPDGFTLGGVEYPTLDGDKHDLRFLDPPGHIVALKGKTITGGVEAPIESGFYRTMEVNR
tara:strand:+ start:1269 stop:1985 length:717 start_codon:yes stop_codon:yes gene_type:complete